MRHAQAEGMSLACEASHECAPGALRYVNDRPFTSTCRNYQSRLDYRLPAYLNSEAWQRHGVAIRCVL
jgi:hypothetical protein